MRGEGPGSSWPGDTEIDESLDSGTPPPSTDGYAIDLVPTLFASDDPDAGADFVDSSRQVSDTIPLSASEAEDSRFIPGTVLLERYRIVALIGRGAMGELYRAEDLKLHEPVALKFLPESLANDGAMLARLYREVRIAHQISHPNVCRVFDIGEVEGQHFISMEYIDGENLASLLRRIGHPPHHKAMQIAQQLCLGLGAAHSRGVLHRDIKPANIMIDGRGQAKITDFGLAGLVEELCGREVRAGTPAYMAPEQLHGLEVSVRSDVYALGLVCYELFTGRRAFRKKQRGVPPRPSTLVEGLDPAVERTLLRCLKTDPAERPASVRDVAAMLPGGDPLAAALAAGEIPSPEMVAAAPQAGMLRPGWVFAGIACLFLEIVVVALGYEKTMLYRGLPLDKPPAVLAERARDLVLDLGFDEPADEAFGFRHDDAVVRHLIARDSSPERWALLASGRPPVISFWYRASPRPMPAVAAGYWKVGYDDPPLTLPGMTRIFLDPQGRLIAFRAVLPLLDEPPERRPEEAPRAPWPVANWPLLFAAAGLDPARFEPDRPKWLPPVHTDDRRAWTGSFPEHPEIEVRVEAASFQGRPVCFQIVAPWTVPLDAWSRPVPADSAADAEAAAGGLTPLQILVIAVIVTILVTGIVLAWRNLLGGRGDRQGAFRLALALFVIAMIDWVFWTSHVPSFAELLLFIQAASLALFRSVFLWIVYMALEPFVRQSWPRRIISWSRLLAGRWRDPLVGRDLLVGALVGLGFLVFQVLGGGAPVLFDQPADPLDADVMVTESFEGLPGVLRQLHKHLFFGPLLGLSFLFLLLLLTMILGRERWATAVLWLFVAAALNLGFSGAPPTRIALTAGAALVIFVLERYGLLAMSAATVFYMTMRFFPITADFGAWYAEATILAILLVTLPAIYGGYLALAGQPIWRPNLLEDRVSSSTG